MTRFVQRCGIENAAAMTHELYPVCNYSRYNASYHLNAWSELLRTLLTVTRMHSHMEEPNLDEVCYVFQSHTDGKLYPFMLLPDYSDMNNLCFMSPFDCFVDYNQQCHQNLKGFDNQVGEFPVLYRRDLEVEPHFKSFVLSEDENDRKWRRYLQHKVRQNYVSHFFGQKSKDIVWSIQKVGADAFDNPPMTHEFYQHQQQVLKKTGSLRHPYSIFDTACVSGIFQPYEALCLNSFMVLAKDMRGKWPKLVCAMHVSAGIKGFHSRKIAVNHDPQYRGYSLVPMANLVAIRSFLMFDADATFLNLGINFTDAGTYKDSFPHSKVPLYNFPSFSNQDELNGFLGANTCIA